MYYCNMAIYPLDSFRDTYTIYYVQSYVINCYTVDGYLNLILNISLSV